MWVFLSLFRTPVLAFSCPCPHAAFSSICWVRSSLSLRFKPPFMCLAFQSVLPTLASAPERHRNSISNLTSLRLLKFHLNKQAASSPIPVPYVFILLWVLPQWCHSGQEQGLIGGRSLSLTTHGHQPSPTLPPTHPSRSIIAPLSSATAPFPSRL